MAAPAGSAWAAHLSSRSKTTNWKTHVYKGPIEQTRWGPIQAAIKVSSKKIVKVGIGNAPDSARSQFIQGQALPMLKAETLQAQSLNINEVSGATDVSSAYLQSLQAAIKSAVKHKALRSKALQ